MPFIDETLPVVCIAMQNPNDPSSVLKYEKDAEQYRRP
jgi:hypothetical protein